MFDNTCTYVCILCNTENSEYIYSVALPEDANHGENIEIT
jgi:hypothetical protein